MHVREYYRGSKHDSKDDILEGLMFKKIIKMINIKKFNKV